MIPWKMTPFTDKASSARKVTHFLRKQTWIGYETAVLHGNGRVMRFVANWDFLKLEKDCKQNEDELIINF